MLDVVVSHVVRGSRQIGAVGGEGDGGLEGCEKWVSVCFRNVGEVGRRQA